MTFNTLLFYVTYYRYYISFGHETRASRKYSQKGR